jgi:hypothetical protein
VAALLPAALNLFSLGFFLAGATAMLSAMDRSRTRAIGVVVGFFAVEIIVKLVAVSSPSWRWLRYGSVLTAFEPQRMAYYFWPEMLALQPEESWRLLIQYNGLLLALGVAGLLLTDLPAGGDPSVESLVRASPLDLIRLVAPTTRPERMTAALEGAEGFVYLIARLGVTGASAALAEGLEQSIARVRRATRLPVAVGFGISTPGQARAVAAQADGVVVGSALVDVLGTGGVDAAHAFLSSLREALDHRMATA